MSVAFFNVRDFGAKGDGLTVDTAAVNRAIDETVARGGGTVLFPAGSYLTHSVRLRSNLTLHLEAGATLIAADPGEGGDYDAAEPNEWGDVHGYQDFGHSHWHNSLIWGENLENVSILGPGRIWGRGLTRGFTHGVEEGHVPANKAIALKLCRNVIFRDFSILEGGHFAVLATGVDNFTLCSLKIDTNRDGLDIDCCRHVRISDCTVNSPNDDAIVLKTSFALGRIAPTENVTITNCQVCGFDVGTYLDGTFRRQCLAAPDRDGPTGRIKLGTESNGPFRNITISNCVFERSRGIAIESVDGSEIENVVISNVAMREVTNSPVFIRLGNRARGPAGTRVGSIRRVSIHQLHATAVDGRFPIVIAGLPEHRVHDLTLSDVHVSSMGGVSMRDVVQQPDTLVNSFFLRGDEPGVVGPRDPFAVPERQTAYPEPSMFGLLPAAAMYVRHAANLVVKDFSYSAASPDERPRVVLSDVVGAEFRNAQFVGEESAEEFVTHDVSRFSKT
jgi:polygalacturonase